MSLTATDFILLKNRVKAEMTKRSYHGSLSAYAGTAYDFTTTPTADNLISAEQGQKVIDLMLRTKEISGFAAVQQGDTLPTGETTTVVNRNYFTLSKMDDVTNFVSNADTDFTNKPFRWYNGSAAIHTFTEWSPGVYQDTVLLNAASNLGICFGRLASDMNLDTSSQYTISCWAKCTKRDAHLDIGLSYYTTGNEWVWRGGSNSQNFSAINSWQKFSLTFTPDANTQAIDYCFTVVGVANGTDTFTIRHCKLEKGSTATDWAPAPEDLGITPTATTTITRHVIENELIQIESQALTASSSTCNGACTGLCSNTCAPTCGGGCNLACTGCSGCSGCGSSCTNQCYGCTGACFGCSTGCGTSCRNSCGGNCSTLCGGCTGGCGGSCSGKCESACSGGCYAVCSKDCVKSCKGGCGGSGCKGGCYSCDGCAGGCKSKCTTGCVGCKGCSGCSSCNGCSGCTGCSGCSGCSTGCVSGCKGCVGCSTGCKSCTGCTGCGNTCNNTCSGACNGGCLTSCSGSCAVECTSHCFGTCSASATIVAYGRGSTL